MVDLKRQYQNIKAEVDQAIQDVIDSAAFINGPAVQSFSRALEAYLGVKHVIPCANGTDALQLALMALELQPGDEVITPSFTYIATVEVVALLRLKPVFVDVDPDTFTMDPEALRRAITPKTKAIIPVHLYGQSAAMAEILDIGEATGVPVIEDNAQALGGHYVFPDGRKVKTGAMGKMGCTSFFPSKNLGCFGDGGAIFTQDDTLAQRLRMLANHGQQQRYYHELVGCNSRLDSIQAAVLNVKLRYLDAYCEARRRAAARYDEAFREVGQLTLPARVAYSHHVFHQYTLKVGGDVDRDELKRHLEARGIPSMIYYPVPCHKQKMFAGQPLGAYHLPVTDALTPAVISLPIHTELEPGEIDFIAGAVKEILQERG